MKKIKNRLDAFNDAVIAIVITIMVLDIPSVTGTKLADFHVLFTSLMIYFISFIFIANMWYQVAVLFGEVETISYGGLIVNFVFLAFLALIPSFTGMMAEHTTIYSVTFYGLLSLIVNILFQVLTLILIPHKETEEAAALHAVYRKIYGSRGYWQYTFNLLAIIIGFFQPQWSFLFYFISPLWIFFTMARDRQEMADVAELPKEDQQAYIASRYRDIREFYANHGRDYKPRKPARRDLQQWLKTPIDPKDWQGDEHLGRKKPTKQPPQFNHQTKDDEN